MLQVIKILAQLTIRWKNKKKKLSCQNYPKKIGRKKNNKAATTKTDL